MKIRKQLQIANEPIALVTEQVNMASRWAGKARFWVQQPPPPAGPVRYQLGYASRNTLHTLFTGYIERTTEVSPGKWQVIARETAGAAESRCPLALRHPTLQDVLSAITQVTGVVFVVNQEAEYAKRRIPYFYHVGNGIEALQAIGRAFNVTDYFWQQQGDGRVFVGSYTHSHWAQTNIDVPVQYTQWVDGDSLKLPVIPSLKPGANINGRRVAEVSLADSHMVVRW